MEEHTIAWIVGGVFAILAFLISCHLVVLHLTHYTKPEYQRYIMRIVLMVPIYAIDSWLSLRFKEFSTYLDTARDCYEAYVIYNFLALLYAYLGGEMHIIQKLESSPPRRYPFPFCYLKPFYPGTRKFLQNVRRGVLQFTIVKPTMGVLAMALEWGGLYHLGQWHWDNSWPYIAFINNASITVAMYYLVLFYLVSKDILSPFKPFYKFACIKAVIFFSFWQEVVLAGLVKIQVIHDVGSYTSEDVSTGVQNFLICFEMALAALMHQYAFPFSDFKDEAKYKTPLLGSFKNVVDQRDILQDAHQTFPVFRKNPSASITQSDDTGAASRETDPDLDGHFAEPDGHEAHLTTTSSSVTPSTSTRSPFAPPTSAAAAHPGADASSSLAPASASGHQHQHQHQYEHQSRTESVRGGPGHAQHKTVGLSAHPFASQPPSHPTKRTVILTTQEDIHLDMK